MSKCSSDYYDQSSENHSCVARLGCPDRENMTDWRVGESKCVGLADCSSGVWSGFTVICLQMAEG